jgi:hypothetical protein
MDTRIAAALTEAGIAYTYGVDPGADTDEPMFRVALDDLDRANAITAALPLTDDEQEAAEAAADSAYDAWKNGY